MKKEEAIFEEKFRSGYISMRKSLILDDFDKLRILSLSNLVGSTKLNKDKD
jgi:hypothetical protein